MKIKMILLTSVVALSSSLASLVIYEKFLREDDAQNGLQNPYQFYHPSSMPLSDVYG